MMQEMKELRPDLLGIIDERISLMNIPIRNRYFLSGDLLFLPVAVYLSFVLRLEVLNIAQYWLGFAIVAVLSAIITPIVFQHVGIYSRYWRYASIEELLSLSGAVSLSVIFVGAAALLGDYLISDRILVPRSIPFIFALLALMFTALPRLAVRLMSPHDRKVRARRQKPEQATPVLVMGAGSAGAMMVRELSNNPQLDMKVVGFIDDDPLKRDVRIHSIRVLGDRDDIPHIVRTYKVQQVIIAMPTASGKAIREIMAICERSGVEAKIIPGIYELIGGNVSVNQLRDIQIEDLLRRQPVRTNVKAVGELIRGKRVLVTGGGGSIGSELCRQVLRFKPSQLVIVGHGENSLFTIRNELRQQLPPDVQVETAIADIRFAERLLLIFNKYQPEIVFHAAAHKHVPLMEENPSEAITNNVLGVRNLLNAAQAVGVEHFVMISTDKAVNPTSIMGASKRVAELLVHQAAKKSGKAYLAVRFGNVLGSRGSVVLTFKQQIANGGPVTVTHPDMQRYFMTIPEAVQLVLQAATLGRGGEVFTLNMGEPVKIVDLARDMIELSGLEVGRDIDITFSGLRPGEKLYEELFIPGETYDRTFHEKIFIARNASSFVPNSLQEAVYALELAAQRDDKSAILRTLCYLVPQMERPDLDALTTDVATKESQPLPEPLLARAVGG